MLKNYFPEGNWLKWAVITRIEFVLAKTAVGAKSRSVGDESFLYY